MNNHLQANDRCGAARPLVAVCDRDLPEDALHDAEESGVVAWDIETTGLDWRTERIATCQVSVGDRVYIVTEPNTRHPVLERLLENVRVLKVFHHAMFDLRFMVHHWRATPRNIACTKVASKILRPHSDSHTLKELVKSYCGVELDKQWRFSNWRASHLSDDQLQYAANDVVFLPALLEHLRIDLEQESRWHLAEASFEYLVTRVFLDLLGCPDVFQY